MLKARAQENSISLSPLWINLYYISGNQEISNLEILPGITKSNILTCMVSTTQIFIHCKFCCRLRQGVTVTVMLLLLGCGDIKILSSTTTKYDGVPLHASQANTKLIYRNLLIFWLQSTTTTIHLVLQCLVYYLYLLVLPRLYLSFVQTTADNIIKSLWNLMNSGVEELKLLQTAILMITTNSLVQHESLARVCYLIIIILTRKWTDNVLVTGSVWLCVQVVTSHQVFSFLHSLLLIRLKPITQVIR